MEENQTNQNLNQQPVQPVQPQPEQVQQPVQWQPEPQQPATDQQQVQQWQAAQQQPVEWQQPQPAQPVGEPTVSMQIQQLLVQQQQYQQQYNQLVDYVKKTPNLPIEQVNQIKAQLDQLNALFVLWKQQLQALWYTSVQVTKPTNIKKWAKANFSFKKLAIWCIVVLLLIFTAFWVTLTSLISNPQALQWIWIDAPNAKLILQVFTGLLFWSILILMLWLIIANIYRLITVKNQWKVRYVVWLLGWLFWTILFWVIMLLIYLQIEKISIVEVQVTNPIIQPYLVWVVEKQWDEFKHPYDANGKLWKAYPLIAPSEFTFGIRKSELTKYQYENKDMWWNVTIQSLTLACWNEEGQKLELSGDVSQIYEADSESIIYFKWRCLYWQKKTYNYSLEIVYKDNINNQLFKKVLKMGSSPLKFKSEILIYLTTNTTSSSTSTTNRVYPTKWEFNLRETPAKVTIETKQVFRDFVLKEYREAWSMTWTLEWNRINMVNFNYSYLIPRVYYPRFTFPELSDFVYAFPIRVEQSDRPVCYFTMGRYLWTTKYNIFSNFTNPSDATRISSYNYLIKDAASGKIYDSQKNQKQEIIYTFPEKWSYTVILDYVTVDWKQWRCESDVIFMEKQTFDIQYALLAKNEETWKFRELCNSKSANWCKQVKLSKVPQQYQIQIKSITPSSNTLRKIVSLNWTSLLNENDIYTFEISEEWVYDLIIAVDDAGRWMEQEARSIRFVAQKDPIVWVMTITSAETDEKKRKPVKEWFEPLTVILDASKTEVNIEWDEIIYFTWDFGDGEIKRNIQNWVVAHTYNYDYARENWIFQPKVSIITRWGSKATLYWPKLNVKKWLLTIDITPTSHPSRQAPVWKEVTFSAEFDWLPEQMIWDFGDGTEKVSCKWRSCTEISHTFEKAWVFSVKLSLEFDAIQQVDETMDFKVYEGEQ